MQMSLIDLSTTVLLNICRPYNRFSYNQILELNQKGSKICLPITYTQHSSKVFG